MYFNPKDWLNILRSCKWLHTRCFFPLNTCLPFWYKRLQMNGKSVYKIPFSTINIMIMSFSQFSRQLMFMNVLYVSVFDACKNSIILPQESAIFVLDEFYHLYMFTFDRKSVKIKSQSVYFDWKLLLFIHAESIDNKLFEYDLCEYVFNL